MPLSTHRSEEPPDQRFKRLRPLIPNCVADAAIRTRMEAGMSDQQLVSTDLVPWAVTGRARGQMFRRSSR